MGQRFFRWKVLEDQEFPWVTHVKCVCECGTKRKVDANNLVRGGTKSCGCYRLTKAAELAPSRRMRHVHVGDVYGRLTVTNADVRNAIVCDCACGNTHTVLASSLVTGNTKSCGCWRSDMWSATLKRAHAERGHTGISAHPAYAAWARIRNYTRPERREYDPAITVHPAWLDPNVFCADVTAEIGERPGAKAYVMRINPDGGFVPGNIMWGDQSMIGKRRETGKFPTETRREMASMVVDLGFKQVDVAAAYGVIPTYISNVVKAYRTGKL